MTQRLFSFSSLVATCLLACCCAATLADEPPLRIGSRLELMVDGYLVGELRGAASPQLHEPIDRGVALAFDRPWEGPFCGYVTVIHDGPKYRLYYRGMPGGGDGSDNESTCYAESDDGVTWTRPNLGLFEVNGSKDNNIILRETAPLSHNFSPFRDANPDAPDDQRYKALAGLSKSGLFAFVSADGVHWRKLRDEPVMADTGWVYDSQNVAFWSESEKQYVLYYRKVLPPAKVRAVARSTSADFIHWTEPVMMTYSDTGTDVPSNHLYTNQTSPYFRAPHLYVAIAARFMPKRQVLSDAEAVAINVDPRYFKDTADIVLLTTRGGNRYDRTHAGAFIKPGIGARNWVSRTNYPALNVVRTGEAEMSLYVNQDYAQPTAHLRRYTMRLDGFASIRASAAGGELVTRPLVFEGERLWLNFATSAAGGIRVEVQDADGVPLPGFALEDSVEVIGNEIERAVSWQSGGDVSMLAGRPVRLRFVMKDADLYALRFK